MFNFRNNYFNICIIIILIEFILFQSNIIYSLFEINYLPVFDGVMYEKNQISRFLSFKGNYSFTERYNQFIYEITGNPVSGGFNSLMLLINPKLLINNIDIHIRSFIALFFLLYSLKIFLNFKNNINYILYFILIFQLPIFYHFRFGLSSYVPDLTSALFLLASYFFTLSFIKTEKLKYFTITVFLILIAILSRFNFFIYTTLIFIPLIPELLKTLKKVFNNKILFKIHLSIWVLTTLIISIYIIYHFDFFISYYTKPAKYATVNFWSSIYSVSKYFYEELGLTYISIIICALFLRNRNRQTENDNNLHWIFLALPFLLLFIFLIFILNATNQPHVFTILVVFSIPLTNIRLPIINRSSSNIIIATLITISIISSITKYHDLYKSIESKSIESKSIDCNSIVLAKKIDFHTNKSIKKSYFIIFDTSQEIPLDVFFFKKYKYFNQNILKYYFTDWDYYNIDKSLNHNKITSYYIRKITELKPKLIILNKFPLKLGIDRLLAEKINITLVDNIKKSKFYYKIEEFKFNKQILEVYKRSSPLLNHQKIKLK